MKRSNFKYVEQFSHPVERVAKICLFDFDSIVHTCLYQGKNEETGELNPEYTMADIEFLQGKMQEQVFRILNKVEEFYPIQKLYCFIGGKGNFRKKIYPEYKAHRKEPHVLLPSLMEYAKLAYNCIEAHGFEADDYVYTFSKKLEHKGLILGIDEDLLSIPGLHYNYSNKDIWVNIDEKTGVYNMYKKLCLGCSSDGVNLTKGLGDKHYSTNYNKDMSIEEYENQLLKSYLKVYKGDETLAKEKIVLAKKLLKLHDVETYKPNE